MAVTMLGSRLAHYEILSTLGKGGMGEVWRARDTRLDREVAIKTLPPEFAGDEAWLARFEREAKSLAALNHSNVASIHGFEEDDGRHFLVLELVEGETLEKRLQRGAIAVDEALGIAIQIAQALEAAHDRGIVHRDLKPANIKIAPDGTVKVLDFGLAKPFVVSDKEDGLASTLVGATKKGALLGTPAYMSPEQVRGETIDTRADIWAFGVVFSEMLTGQPLFHGGSPADTLARVLAPGPVEPNLPTGTPPLVTRLIRRCLEKRREDRLRHIGDARIDIRDALDGTVYETDMNGRARRGGVWLGAASGAVLVLVAAIAWIWTGQRDEAGVIEQYPIRTVEPIFGLPREQLVAVSQDGSRIAYGTNGATFVYSTTQGSAVRVDGTGGFFSPDGQWIATYDNGYLFRTPVIGGTSSRIASLSNRQLGGSWGHSGQIVFATNNGLFRIAEDGASPEMLIAPDPARGERYLAHPEWLPGDRSIVFTILPDDSAAAPRIGALDLETRRLEALALRGMGPRYLASGHLVFSDGGRLAAVTFDPETWRVGGERIELGYQIRPDAPTFAIAADTLAFVPPESQAVASMAWVNPADGTEQPSGIEHAYIYPRISPDGRKVIGDTIVDGNRDLFIWDFDRRLETRFTTDPREDLFAVWSEDGETIYFSSNRSGVMNLHYGPANRSQPARPFFVSPNAEHWLMSRLPDGSGLLVRESVVSDTPESNFISLTLADPPRRDVVMPLYAGELNAVASPDGRWLAYQSNETGQTEVWVRRLDDVDGQQFQASRAGGSHPMWSPDGTTLYYKSFSGIMQAVAVRYEPEFSLGEIVEAFPNRGYFVPASGPIIGPSGRDYDIAADGRILVRKTLGAEPADTVRLVRNWSLVLK